MTVHLDGRAEKKLCNGADGDTKAPQRPTLGHHDCFPPPRSLQVTTITKPLLPPSPANPVYNVPYLAGRSLVGHERVGRKLVGRKLVGRLTRTA